LEDAPIYEFVILAALAAAAGPIFGELTPAALTARPVTVCVLGVMAAVVLSHLTHGAVADARESGAMFLKIVLYYLLLVANVRTVRRLQLFLHCVSGLLMVQVGFGLLQYGGYIDVEALSQHAQKEYDPQTGEFLGVKSRLCGAGIFHDPNDLCVLLVVGVLIALFQVTDRRLGLLRFAWVVPLAVFAGSIPLTHSRGGMLALVGGLGTLVIARLGVRRGGVLLLVLLPGLLVALSGRMTRFDLDNPNDTSQHRIRAWSDGLLALRDTPLFGAGQGKYEELSGMPAHNSFVHAFTELGFVGGTCFLAAFAYTVWVLARLRSRLSPRHEPTLARLRPYLMAMVIALMTGMISLSRNYTPPTYLILGLGASYLGLAAARAPGAVPRLTTALTARGVGLGVLSLIALQVLTTTLVRW
jgi:hypothetical protein